MSSNKNQSFPATIQGSLDQALASAAWITKADFATVVLAKRLALALDTAFDTGELKEVSFLAQRFTVLLQQLHLTVETRIQGKQEEENDGSEHRDAYLRLLSTAPNVPKTGSSKRGAGS